MHADDRSICPVTARAIASAVILAFGAGCTFADFVKTSRFDSRPRPHPPAIFLDRDPARPFREVGIITVTGDNADFASTAAPAAAKRGQEVGCDVIRYRGGRDYGDAAGHPEQRFACGIYEPEK